MSEHLDEQSRMDGERAAEFYTFPLCDVCRYNLPDSPLLKSNPCKVYAPSNCYFAAASQEAKRRRKDDAREAIVAAARALLDKLDKVHDDPDYRAVWEIAQLHRGPYAGATYTEELAALRSAVEKAGAVGGNGETQ